jgi:glycosyltransferase involved in cell wall biosynthesis
METLYESRKDFGNQNGDGNAPISVVHWKAEPILSVVMPAYNEADTIKDIVTEYFEEIISKLPSRLIVAEDGSSDKTPQILASLANKIPITLFSERRRKGYAKGVNDALEKCEADWIFFSDSDGQYFPSDFWRLWENRDGYDMIIGHKVRRNEGIHRIILSRGFHLIVNKLFGLRLSDGDCGFRLIRKEVIQSVGREARFLKYSFWTEFTIRACLKGFKVHEVPINHANRTNGGTRIYAPSKIPLIILKQLKDLIKVYIDLRKGLGTHRIS